MTSENDEVLYTLEGTLTFKFEEKIVSVRPLTYLKIQSGTPYSFANKGRRPAKSLAISVIAPVCTPPAGPPVAGSTGGSATAAR